LTSTPSPPDRRLTIIRALAFLIVMAIAVLIFAFRNRIQDLYQYGYVGIFLATMLANATVLVPVPGFALVFAMGAVLNPLITAIVAGLGGATGELTGYLVGFSGQGLIEKSERARQIYAWISEHRRYAGLAIVVLSAIPNPFFDVAGVAAGALKMPLGLFWVYCALGSIVKMLMIAYLGSSTLNFFFKP
jgi:membrane protein YqaA with SNARE-associated domain